MSRPPIRNIIVGVVGGAAALAALTAMLLEFLTPGVFEGCTITASFGWTVPLIAGLVIAAVSWLLLDGPEGGSHTFESRSSACRVCGERVNREWRLCPYCGSMLRSLERAGLEKMTPEDAV